MVDKRASSPRKSAPRRGPKASDSKPAAPARKRQAKVAAGDGRPKATAGSPPGSPDAAREPSSWEQLGELIRTQRRLANLSLRQLADRARVSNPYLSQIERGIHRPSAQVLKGIADALQMSAETLYERVGLIDRDRTPRPQTVEEAIRFDARLTREQKQALITVYRGFVT